MNGAIGVGVIIAAAVAAVVVGGGGGVVVAAAAAAAAASAAFKKLVLAPISLYIYIYTESSRYWRRGGISCDSSLWCPSRLRLSVLIILLVMV